MDEKQAFSISRDYMIPEVDNKEDYKVYKHRLAMTVPVKTTVICKNKFTGNVISKPKGIHFFLPWVSSKLVSNATKVVDYPADVYKTRDGIEVTIDFALTLQITDSLAFEINSQNPLQEVGFLTMDLMRSYVASRDAEDLYRSTIDLENIDSKGHLHKKAKEIGVDVTNFYVKNIDLPQTIKDDFEKQVEAIKEREISKIQDETAQIKANTEAATAKILAKGKAEAAEFDMNLELKRLREIINVLVQSGCNEKQIIEYLRNSQFANGSAQVIANIDGNNMNGSSLTAAQMVANAVKTAGLENMQVDENTDNDIKSRGR